jgi:predicted nucleic acid-binding protein
MPHVLIDTSVLLPATLSPGGMARKLWLLLAFGALELQVERTESLGHKTLRELLPENAPTDWVALGARALFDEYERKVRARGHRLSPSVRPRDVMPLRRQVEAICVAASPLFEPNEVPRLTRDSKDDPIVYAALLGGADYLISDDRDIVPDGSEHGYEHDDCSVRAITFNRLVTSYFAPADLDWGAIDGLWLRHALGDLAGAAV